MHNGGNIHDVMVGGENISKQADVLIYEQIEQVIKVKGKKTRKWK